MLSKFLFETLRGYRAVATLVVAIRLFGQIDTPQAREIQTLLDGERVQNLLGLANAETHFRIAVPADQWKLEVKTSDGRGDCDLFVRRGALATRLSYDGKSTQYGNSDSVAFYNPEPGDWYILLYADSAYSRLALVADIEPLPTMKPLENNVPDSDLGGAASSWRWFRISVPPNQAKLEISTLGGSGNCDLYVEKDFIPPDSRFDYESQSRGNVEKIVIDEPGAGDYLILVFGRSAYSAMTLVAKYEPFPPANGHYYGISTTAGTWDDVEAEAVLYGGHLVSIANRGEQRFLVETFLVDENSRRTFWIGLTDRVREGDFRWVDGEPFDYSNWNHQEPNNCGGEDYGTMNWHRAHNRSNSSLGDWNDGSSGISGGIFIEQNRGHDHDSPKKCGKTELRQI